MQSPRTLTRSAFQRSEIARKLREQRAHLSRPGVGDGLSRAALRQALERSILLDARSRARSKALKGPFIDASCRPTRADRQRAQDGAPTVRYDCIAVTFRSTTRPPLVTGTPFLARVDYQAKAYAWCLFTPIGGEGTYNIKTLVPPPKECTAS